MKKNKSYQIITLLTATLLSSGCTGTPKTVLKTQKTMPQAMVKPSIKKATTGVRLSALQNLGSMNVLSFKTKKAYSENESIKFVVDTGDQEGYLYIIYLDNQGKTALLYPNAKSPLTEMGGSFLFPNDFGNVKIRATKDCKNCSEETTTIYALLSKTPILDIQNINKETLLGLSSPTNPSRALQLELNGQENKQSQLHIGKVEFLVQ